MWKAFRFLGCLIVATAMVLAWKIYPFAKNDPIGYVWMIKEGGPLIPTWKGRVMRASGQYCTAHRDDYKGLFPLQQRDPVAFGYYRRSGAILFVDEGTPVKVTDDDGEYVRIEDSIGAACWTLRSRL